MESCIVFDLRRQFWQLVVTDVHTSAVPVPTHAPVTAMPWSRALDFPFKILNLFSFTQLEYTALAA
jgi:hypothetical protein